MEMGKNRKSVELVVMITISALISVTAVYVLPPLINVGMGKEEKFTMFFVTGFWVIGVVIIGILTFWQRQLQEETINYKKKRGEKKDNWGKSLGRVLVSILTIFFVIILFSLLSGIVAVVLYAIFKTTLTLGQIKGIIDLLITGITFLIMPFLIAIFWRTFIKDESIFQVVIRSLRIKGKCYVQLLMVIGVLFGIGMLLMTMFRYVSDAILVSVIKTILFTLIGTVALKVTKSIVVSE